MAEGAERGEQPGASSAYPIQKSHPVKKPAAGQASGVEGVKGAGARQLAGELDDGVADERSSNEGEEEGQRHGRTGGRDGGRRVEHDGEHGRHRRGGHCHGIGDGEHSSLQSLAGASGLPGADGDCHGLRAMANPIWAPPGVGVGAATSITTRRPDRATHASGCRRRLATAFERHVSAHRGEPMRLDTGGNEMRDAACRR